MLPPFPLLMLPADARTQSLGEKKSKFLCCEFLFWIYCWCFAKSWKGADFASQRRNPAPSSSSDSSSFLSVWLVPIVIGLPFLAVSICTIKQLRKHPLARISVPGRKASRQAEPFDGRHNTKKDMLLNLIYYIHVHLGCDIHVRGR